VKKLVIAEKPSVAEQLAAVIDHCKKTREYYEGDHYIVSWAVGHLVGLAEPEDYDKKNKQWLLANLPIIPEKFRFAVLEGAEQRFGALRKLLVSDEVEEVINACDAGREGELIFRNIYSHAKATKPSSRLWLSSYTEESIREGFSRIKPEESYDDLGRAALARSQSDWLVGINATRGLTRRNGSLVTVGRVQTPVLALIAKKEKEVLAFTAEPYFEVTAKFKVVPQGEPVYQGLWHRGSESRLSDQGAAEDIVARCERRQGTISSVVQKENRMAVPYLLDLGLLQREANTLFGLSASRTLKAAQSLYEEKRAITYPRTDSKFLPKALKKEVSIVLKDLGTDEYAEYVNHILRERWSMRGFVFDDAKVSDHYAIIPTGTRIDRSSLGHDESVVYDLVVRRFLAQFYPDARFMLTHVETVVQGEMFGSDGRVLLEQGWLEVAPRDADTRDLPVLRENVKVQTYDIGAEKKLTKAPPRFTDASIIAAMETAGKLVDDEDVAEAMKERGLGTPATRAEILEKLIRTGMVERRARSLVATKRGIDLIDLLETIKLSELVLPDLTGEWEMNLREIEKGSLKSGEFMKRIEAFTRQMVDKIKNYETETQIGVESTEAIGDCPLCGGHVFERPASYVCEHHGRKKTDCRFGIPKTILRRPMSRAEVTQLIADRKTDMLQGFVSKRGFKFDARLTLKPDGNLEWEFAGREGSDPASEEIVNAEALGRCPICQGTVVESTDHYRCSDTGCRFQMKKTYAGKNIDRVTARSLLAEGKTPLIEDFISRYNKPFSAYLKIGEKGRVEFEFLNRPRRAGKSPRKKGTPDIVATTSRPVAKSTGERPTVTKKTPRAATKPSGKAAAKPRKSNHKGGAS
jgi:DNA topoisomerase-3